MSGEPSEAQREAATLDELEADIDLVDAAMTHVAEGNLDAADAAVSALDGSAKRDDDPAVDLAETPVAAETSDADLVDGQDEASESVPVQPFRPAS